MNFGIKIDEFCIKNADNVLEGITLRTVVELAEAVNMVGINFQIT